jgi:hypothetical protein
MEESGQRQHMEASRGQPAAYACLSHVALEDQRQRPDVVDSSRGYERGENRVDEKVGKKIRPSGAHLACFFLVFNKMRVARG